MHPSEPPTPIPGHSLPSLQIKFRRRLYDMDELAVFYHQDAILEFFSVSQSSVVVTLIHTALAHGHSRSLSLAPLARGQPRQCACVQPEGLVRRSANKCARRLHPYRTWLRLAGFCQKWELRVAVMHRDDMVEAAMMGDLERVDVQLQRDLPDINHVNRKVRASACELLWLRGPSCSNQTPSSCFLAVKSCWSCALPFP